MPNLSALSADSRFDVHYSFPRRSLSEALTTAAKPNSGDDSNILYQQEVSLETVGVSADTVFYVTVL